MTQTSCCLDTVDLNIKEGQSNIRFLILGGASFIGSHLCDALLSAGYQVRAFKRPETPSYRKFNECEAIEWVYGDFNSEADLRRAVDGCHIVIHLITTTFPKSSNLDPIYDVQSNVIGTLRLLEISRSYGIKKIVFLSSGGTVYGTPDQVPISEESRTNPICSYGIAKLTIEKYLHLYYLLHGLDYTVLRIANPYGERQRTSGSQGVIPILLNRAIENQVIEIWGDGSIVRDYIYISDVIDAIIKAALYSGEEHLFNIGSGKGKSLNELLTSFEALLNRPVERCYVTGRNFDVPVNILSIARAQSYLSWSPTVSFEQGLLKTYQSFDFSKELR